jgi:hypothetical protein
MPGTALEASIDRYTPRKACVAWPLYQFHKSFKPFVHGLLIVPLEHWAGADAALGNPSSGEQFR